jgi:hypothetical protein
MPPRTDIRRAMCLLREAAAETAATLGPHFDNQITQLDPPACSVVEKRIGLPCATTHSLCQSSRWSWKVESDQVNVISVVHFSLLATIYHTKLLIVPSFPDETRRSKNANTPCFSVMSPEAWIASMQCPIVPFLLLNAFALFSKMPC